VRDDFIKTVMELYDCMMTCDGNINCYKNAFIVHRFLMQRKNLLQSRFIFFLQNVGTDHWVISCLCNPWIYLQKAAKQFDIQSLTERFEHVDSNFIHGWLLFDPLVGFLNKDHDNEYFMKARDVLVWLLNLANLYSVCESEKTSSTLDFVMHRYLRSDQKSKWLKRFNMSKAFMDTFDETQKKIEDKSGLVPPSFHHVVKWFIRGLLGPFGKVTGCYTKALIFHMVPEDTKVGQKQQQVQDSHMAVHSRSYRMIL
jgi:hypothetical protein